MVVSLLNALGPGRIEKLGTIAATDRRHHRFTGDNSGFAAMMMDHAVPVEGRQRMVGHRL
jgi:hypothetical protein